MEYLKWIARGRTRSNVAFELARRPWIPSLEGHLTPPNEPEEVIEKALEAGWKETLSGRRQATRARKTKSQ
ncbi:MAG TPA: hypothetical protein VLZ81_00590 [Blastocatellia bacterium]|nr:hypothetical protein [Blastocatellia bacterium]